MSKLTGPFFILISALLWGTDSLFSYSLTSRIDATWIVLIEHLGIFLLAPTYLKATEKGLFKLGWKEWIFAVIIGAGGGALATVLFTASFKYVHPSVAILLQKLQPIITVMIASVFLGEKPSSSFYPWALLGLGSAIVLSFPDLNFQFMFEPQNLQAQGVGLAIASATIWSVTTVAGKRVLQTTSTEVATFWRYFFGLVTLILLVYAGDIPFPNEVLSDRPIQLALIYLTIMTGIVPMLAYYAGLSRTSASIATFVELAYPLSAIGLNAWLAHQHLSPMQMGAAGLLLFSMTMLSLF